MGVEKQVAVGKKLAVTARMERGRGRKKRPGHENGMDEEKEQGPAGKKDW